jgi:hypothetical protein
MVTAIDQPELERPLRELIVDSEADSNKAEAG